MTDHVLTDTFFESFNLHPLLQQGLADCGFTRLTPIQALTLPVALSDRDVAGQAQTGTGKTCAFLVALMNRLLTQPARAARRDTDPRALVIAPTRELAIQIDKDARAIGAHTELQTALIYGGVDYDKQRQMLRAGCDIIIATPGRMLDYHKQHVFRLDNVEVMVIDEADRMFDLGFIKDVRYIFRRLPPRDERQVLLYSATLSHRVLELAYEHMHEAEKLVAETDTITADKVRQVVYYPAKEEKPALLLNLLAREKPERALVFVNTRAQTDRVRDRLRRHGYRVGGLSGDVPQDKRQKILKRFKNGDLDMLVCTDVAARGLHIPHVSHVINYDLPQDAEDYVHRIGRTARLGEEGDAISFACDLYAMSLPDIETFIEQKIPVASVEPELLVMPEPAPDTGGAHRHDEHARKASGEGDRPKRGRRRKPPAHQDGNGPGGNQHAQAQAGAPAATAECATKTASGAASRNAEASQDKPADEREHASGAPRQRQRRRRRGGRHRKRQRPVQSSGSPPSASAPEHASSAPKQTGDGAARAPASSAPPSAERQDRVHAAKPSPHRSRSGEHHQNRTRSHHHGAGAHHDGTHRQATRPMGPASAPARGKSTQVPARSVLQGHDGGFFKRLTRGLFRGRK
jgi:ATP-dependent RNA helicase RhlB